MYMRAYRRTVRIDAETKRKKLVAACARGGIDDVQLDNGMSRV